MRVLLITNLIYAFVLPVIDVFVGAYVMRNSQDVSMVVHLSDGGLHRHPIHVSHQWLPAAAREHQAALLGWHAAERRVDGGDDVARQTRTAAASAWRGL